MSDDQKFRDKAEREIFAAAMEARNRQFPWNSPDEVAGRAWAMVLEYRSRCPAHNGCPTAEGAAANDAGPTHADLRGEVDHGD